MPQRRTRALVAFVCWLLVAGLPLTGCASTGAGGTGGGVGGPAGSGTIVGSLKPGSVKAQYVPWVNKAGGLCPQISPPLIAAQIQQESGWDPNARSGAGAVGIAQFMPGTWPSWGEPAADGNEPSSPLNPADAIMAQGRFMCSLAKSATAAVASKSVSGIFIQLVLGGYNAGWGAVQQAGGVPQNAQTQHYVVVIPQIAIGTYGGRWSQPASSAPPVAGASPGAARLIATMQSQLGVPYVWGGGTLTGPSGTDPTSGQGPGFDCSGFMRYGAYVGTGGGLTLQRGASGQQSQLSRYNVPYSGTGSLQPGDVLFNGNPAEHVAVYVGGGKIIEEPKPFLSARITTLWFTPSTVARVPWSTFDK